MTKPTPAQLTRAAERYAYNMAESAAYAALRQHTTPEGRAIANTMLRLAFQAGANWRRGDDVGLSNVTTTLKTEP